MDTHGNVTQTKIYDYGNLSTPARTYNHTYLTGSEYSSRHIWNRLASSTVQPSGGAAVTLVANYYDNYGSLTDRPDIREHDRTNYGSGFTRRGNVTSKLIPGRGLVFLNYDITGTALSVTDGYTTLAGVTTSNLTNYAAPAGLTTTGVTSTLNWTAFLGLSSQTGPNSDVASFTYDTLARPASSTSRYGAVTSYTYSNSPPTRTGTVNGQWRKTTMDGLGRTIKVETGTGTTTSSIVDSEYAPCACSPLGKLWRVSQPYAPGGTVYWTTYTRDALGRTNRVDHPGGTGSTTYVYEGNTLKVTDPAGKWKKYTMNAMGNLTQVTEPAPEGGSHETYYSYNVLNQLTQVQMPRGGYTQTRAFNYDVNTGR